MLLTTLRIIFAVGFVTLAISPRTAESIEDPLLAATDGSHEDPFLPGMNSEFERRALERAGSVAKREGKRLQLFTSERTVSFIDDAPNTLILGANFEIVEDPKCTEKRKPCSTFKLLTYLEKQKLFVVQHAWLDRVDYLLVSDVRGFASAFSDFPYISPDGQYVFGNGHYAIVADNTPDLLEGQPHIEIWTRSGWRYVPDWKGAPHKPPRGRQAYKLDRWISKQGHLETGETLLEAHVEVDGKVTARFQLRDSDGPSELEVIDLP